MRILTFIAAHLAGNSAARRLSRELSRMTRHEMLDIGLCAYDLPRLCDEAYEHAFRSRLGLI